MTIGPTLESDVIHELWCWPLQFFGETCDCITHEVVDNAVNLYADRRWM